MHAGREPPSVAILPLRNTHHQQQHHRRRTKRMERGKPGLRSKKLAILSRSLIICSSSTNEDASSPEERYHEPWDAGLEEKHRWDPLEGQMGNSEKYMTRSVSVQTPQRGQEGPKRTIRRSFSIKVCVTDDITAAGFSYWLHLMTSQKWWTSIRPAFKFPSLIFQMNKFEHLHYAFSRLKNEEQK